MNNGTALFFLSGYSFVIVLELMRFVRFMSIIYMQLVGKDAERIKLYCNHSFSSFLWGFASRHSISIDFYVKKIICDATGRVSRAKGVIYIDRRSNKMSRVDERAEWSFRKWMFISQLKKKWSLICYFQQTIGLFHLITDLIIEYVIDTESLYNN